MGVFEPVVPEDAPIPEERMPPGVEKGVGDALDQPGAQGEPVEEEEEEPGTDDTAEAGPGA